MALHIANLPPRFWRFIGLILLILPYLAYVVFVVRVDRGPIDYETFMTLGQRLLKGEEVYGENSYYPLPFVMIFAFFSEVPRPMSMASWLLITPIAALLMTKGNPLVLLYAPLLGHFVGGQSALFAMVGLWGYRKYQKPEHWLGGFFLSLLLLKPQLGIIPHAYAFFEWWKAWRSSRHIPKQVWAWLITSLALYLPSFFLFPDWPLQWLSHPRPLFERAMSGFLPRTLLFFLSPQTVLYWFVLLFVGGLLLWLVWVLNHQQMSFDLLVLWSFVVNPLVHDYDLVQLVPLLEKPHLLRPALWLSVPGWLVIFFAYGNDIAWYVFTTIAPGLLFAWLYNNRKSDDTIR